MTYEEAIKYLIAPISTSTEPSTEYLKQKEAYDLAIKTLAERPQGEWIKIGDIGLAYTCNKCGEVNVIPTNFCPNCGADMMKGGAE